MAKPNVNRAMPIDEPVLLRPGVMHRETDAPGNAKWYALPPESKERSDKGDLGLSLILHFETAPLSHPGSPFLLKPGKGT